MIRSQCLGFLSTPALWDSKQFDIQQFGFPKLDLDSFQPEVLPGNIRLGHQMEFVFKQLIAHSETYDIILYNLPIRDDKRTLGEIDFILNDKESNQLIHVELTYKFYIIDPEIKEPIHRLIGPNRRDSFIQKMEKIKNIQFPLLHSEAGIQALSNMNIDHLGVMHQCCFKAQLFLPYACDTIDIGSLNQDCLAGFWLRFDDLCQSEFLNLEYYFPTKSEWPIQPHLEVRWISHSEILKQLYPILLQDRSPMLWLKKSKDSFQKCFVVWW